uniref:Uncharacterized protein n=1 Tax=Anguilla anguilla TaxID=7936 RepID=A0A0E9SDY1_ANGAN
MSLRDFEEEEEEKKQERQRETADHLTTDFNLG